MLKPELKKLPLQYKTLLLVLVVFCIGNRAFAQSDSVQGKPNVFTFVEQMPEFPGGDVGLVKFLSQNIVYPQMERDNDIQGRVLLRFIVMEDGSVDGVTVMKGVSPGLDKEAVRVVKALPKFKPGTQQGKPVRVYFNLPIVYKLQDNELQQMLNKLATAVKEKSSRDSDFANAVEQAKGGFYKSALDFLKKSIKRDSKSPLAYDLKGVIELLSGDKKGACRDLRLALEKGSAIANGLLIKNCN